MKKSKLIYNLGKRIAFLRKKKKLSQEEFADASGKMINTISKIERGISDPKVSTLDAIASTLDTTVSSLFADAESVAPIISPVQDKLLKLLEHKDEETLRVACKLLETFLSSKKD